MPTKTAVKPRKNPVQGRSQATVEAILEAAARILVQDGYDRLSTNRVAETAGVSIGSLYQYFPSKEAIIAALVDRLIEEEVGIIERRLLECACEPMDKALQALIGAIVESHGVNPRLHRALMDQVPKVGALEKKMDFEDRLARLVRGVLEERRSELDEKLRPSDLDMASFILVHAVESVIHSALVKRPEYLKSRRFQEEVAALVASYLRG